MKDNGAGESLRTLNVTKDAFSNQRVWKGVPVEEPGNEMEALPGENEYNRRKRVYALDPKKYTRTGQLRLTPEQRAARVREGWSPESRKKLSRSMKKAHKRIPLLWKNRAARIAGEEAPAPPIARVKLQQAETAAPSRPRHRMIGILIDQIRAELHQQIREGGELTPFHTNVLALTDYLRKPE